MGPLWSRQIESSEDLFEEKLNEVASAVSVIGQSKEAGVLTCASTKGFPENFSEHSLFGDRGGSSTSTLGGAQESSKGDWLPEKKCWSHVQICSF